MALSIAYLSPCLLLEFCPLHFLYLSLLNSIRFASIISGWTWSMKIDFFAQIKLMGLHIHYFYDFSDYPLSPGSPAVEGRAQFAMKMQFGWMAGYAILERMRAVR